MYITVLRRIQAADLNKILEKRNPPPPLLGTRTDDIFYYYYLYYYSLSRPWGEALGGPRTLL